MFVLFDRDENKEIMVSMKRSVKIVNLSFLIFFVFAFVSVWEFNVDIAYAFSEKIIASETYRMYGVPIEYTLHVLREAKTVPKIKRFVTRVANAPEKVLPFDKFVVFFVNKKRIKSGVRFLLNHKEILDEVYKKYGVKPSIIVSILSIETDLGRSKLTTSALDALYTLSLYSRRSKYFTYELESLIAYSYKYKIDPLKIKGSITGALGLPQFMPSNIFKYAVDFNHNGLNLDEISDAAASIANYLVHFGYRGNKPIAKFEGMAKKPCDSKNVMSFKYSNGEYACWRVYPNFFALRRYNGTFNYALAVYLLSKEIDQKIKNSTKVR